MNQKNNIETTTTADPITFGSCISLSLEGNENFFLSSEGFLDPNLYVKASTTETYSSEFHFSLFRIMPFSSASNFKSQRTLYNLLQEFNEEAKILSAKSFKERKSTIQELRLNLEVELNANLTIYNKLKGTPVLFETSIFQLVHIATMKYLSLDDSNKDDIQFTLVDYPNEKSFFRFLPCLKLQKQRDNIVLSQELVSVCSTWNIVNRNPYLYTDIDVSYKQDNEKSIIIRKQKSKLIASIEEPRNWRLHLYKYDSDEGHASNFLQPGSVIWLNQSETDHFLSASVQRDPFEDQILDDSCYDTSSLNLQMEEYDSAKDKESGIKLPYGAEKEDQSPGREHLSMSEETSLLTLFEPAQERATEGLMKKDIEMEFVLEFKEMHWKEEGFGFGEIDNRTTNGLWRIEPLKVSQKGFLKWDQHYRLKHLTSGKYLKVSKKQADKYCIELSNEVDEDLLFNFVPLSHLMHSSESTIYISRDSYFNLQHVNTKQWVSLEHDVLQNTETQHVKINNKGFTKEPSLSSKLREIDTFKITKADFEDIWEISFLLSSFPSFVEILEYISPQKEKTVWTSDDIIKFRKFEKLAQNVMDSIDTLKDFSYNRLPGNLVTNQEFAEISPLRQKVLREQNILGLICCLLKIGFPSKKELEKIDWKALDYSFKALHTDGMPIQHLPTTSPSKNVFKRHERVIAEYYKKKYTLCHLLYDFVSIMCIQNPQNQEYASKFLPSFINHLGFGSFVSDCIIKIFHENERLLYNVHQVEVSNKASNIVKPIDLMQKSGLRPAGVNTLLNQIVDKFDDFKPYEKAEFLVLLKKFCAFQDKAIYINQDKIFNLVYEDMEFRDRHLIKFSNKDDQLLINTKGVEFSLSTFFRNRAAFDYQQKLTFLTSQLDLYASLCLDRNYTCSKAIGRVFTINTILSYIDDDNIPEDIRAILVNLIATVHIDKEPRTVKEYPSLVRMIDMRELSPQPKRILFGLITPKSSARKKKKTLTWEDINMDEVRSGLRESKEKEEKLELGIDMITKLKDFIFAHLENQSEASQGKFVKSDEIYTRLTYEVVKLALLMLKFGMFESKVFKQEKRDPNNANWRQRLKTSFTAGKTFLKKKSYKEVGPPSEVEKLIQYLTPLLEFDEAYFRTMEKLGAKRRCFEQVKDAEGLANILGGAANLGKSLFFLKDILNFDEGSGLKKIRKLAMNFNNEGDIINDQIFKKPATLKKVLDKFSSKTYTLKDEEAPTNYEVNIKVQICEIFENILDMRQEFLIDNLVEYFQKNFVEKNYSLKDEEITKLDITSSLKELLPPSYVQAGVLKEEIMNNTKLLNYTEYEEVKSFDDVLGRSFLEALLLGFFFTNASPLQNSLLKLIKKCSTEKNGVRKSLQKLELLFTDENKKLYYEILYKVRELKILTSNAQIWLQIVEKSVFHTTYQDTLDKCQENLKQLEDLFKSHQYDHEMMQIAQKIFSYLGGQKTIFELIQKGLLVLDPCMDAFRDQDITGLGSRYKVKIADKIVQLFKLCHSILGLFCYENPRHQKILFQNLNLLLVVSKLDLGQVDLINNILKNNRELSLLMSDSKLKVLRDLIVQHGKREAFLNVFDTLITNAGQEMTNVQKKVLWLLLDEQYTDSINPFTKSTYYEKEKLFRNSFHPDKDPFYYTSKLLEIIAKCISGKIGVSLVLKVFKLIKIKDLIELLSERTLQQENPEIDMENSKEEDLACYIETAKSSAIDIMLTFFTVSPNTIDVLWECQKPLLDFFTLETNRMLVKTPDRSYTLFIFDKLVPFANIYAETCLKNLSMEFVGNFETKENYPKKKMIKFAEKILTSLDEYEKDITITETHAKNLIRLALNLKIRPPEILGNILAGIEQRREEAQSKDLLRTKSLEHAKRRSSKKISLVKGPPVTLTRIATKFSMTVGGFLLKKQAKSTSEFYDDRRSSRMSALWSIFRDKIVANDYLKEAIKSDLNILPDSIMNFANVFSPSDEKEVNELFITTEDLLLKFLNFLEFWNQKKANIRLVIFVMKALCRTIKRVDSFGKEAVTERQNMLDRLNTTKICIALIRDENDENTQYLYSILNLMIWLLLNGNATVQKTIYDFFLNNPMSESFFRRINNLLLREITNIDVSSKYKLSKEISKLGMKMLRLLQLLCEGHNLDLQNYLRYQSKSKNSYDLVALTTKLLCSYKVNRNNFESVMQCFDTLTEFIQGPCKANQVTIANSKFLEFSVSLLSEEDKVIEYEIPDASFARSGAISLHQSGSRVYSRFNKTSEIKSHSSLNKSSLKHSSMATLPQRGKMKLRKDELAKVKYKCLVTIVSLLECDDASVNLSAHIIRAIPLAVLTNNLIEVYQQYRDLYKDGRYTEEVLNHQNKTYNPANPQESAFIIENGFNIYILINLYLEKSTKETIEEEELKEFIEGGHSGQISAFLNTGFMKELSKFGGSVLSNATGVANLFKKNIYKKMVAAGTLDAEEAQLLQREMEKKQLIREAILFFRSKMGHIEFVRDGNLEKVYFPILPWCKYLIEDFKTQFQEQVDRTSTKTKLASLMAGSDELIRNMKYEERIASVFHRYKLIDLVANHVKLWEYLSFIVTIAINIIFLTPYANDFLENYYTEDFESFYGDSASYVIIVLGVLNLIFSLLVVVNFFLKRAPLLLGDIWEGAFSIKHLSFTKTPLRLLVKLIQSLWRSLNDFDILYYCAVMAAALLGILVHPIAFTFNLTQFFRIGIIKNVVQAIWIGKVQLLLTFLVFILAQYYFTLIGYSYLYDQYSPESSVPMCNSLWKCYLTTFDNTFKNSGAIGGYLVNPKYVLEVDSDGTIVMERGIVDWGRLIFDNAFNITLVLLLINMVAGIIIDTFGVLKNSLLQKEIDMINYCFICGISREMLEKASNSKQGYYLHIKRDHYMWNYIFYKAYLQFKEPTEYNGNDSYIANKIRKFDLGWFPVNRALAMKDEIVESNHKEVLMDVIAQKMSEIKAFVGVEARKMKKLFENTRKYSQNKE